MSTNNNTNGYGDSEDSGEHHNESNNQQYGMPGTSDGYGPPRDDERGNDVGGCGLMFAGAVVGVFFSVLVSPFFFFMNPFVGPLIPPIGFILIGISIILKNEKHKSFGWGLIAGPLASIIIFFGPCALMAFS